ncbi:MAG TPA: patatin-like protein [Angustibacter sp.]|nr:patatin-like protein [Angustibacter sp.]
MAYPGDLREDAVPGPDDTTTTRPKPHTVTELRLALVCYGGVSLAIYMHGVTKELHKLVIASRAFDELGPAAANPFDPRTDTEHAYFEALGDLARDRVLVSANIDIVAGTSAGGINGVCLAKVLARNGSQDALKRLWINEGDLSKLLNAPPVGGWRTRAVLAVGRTLVRLRQPVSPLRGARMSQLLYDAIGAMDQPVEPDRPSLLLPATPLDLFVTTTDLDGSAVLVPSGAGGASQRETNHAQVVQFRARDGVENAFGAHSVGALAFAARATSSFPGAFPPVSLTSFEEEIAPRALDSDAVALMFRRRYADTAAAARRWFVDGGVLDNAPFDLVVEAIAEKRARTEVVRRLVYIQPDPGVALTQQPEEPGGDAGAPGYLKALLRSVVGVKGSHSILRDLEDLRDLNVRVAQLGAIAAQQMHQVTAAIDEAWQQTTGSAQEAWSIDDPDDVKRLADSMYAKAPGFAGAAFTTYCRLKVEAAGERLADEIVARFVYPPGSGRTTFVRAALAAWARGRIEWRQPDPSRLLEMLGPVDVPYRERRLMFILAGINALYPVVDSGPGTPRRSELDALKAKAWELLDDLHEAPRDAVGAVTDSVVAFLGADLSDDAVFANPEAFAAEHDADFTQLFMTYRSSLAEQLADSSVPMWQSFADLTKDWATDTRRELLSRYLGFPLWDALIFPTVALSRLPQFTPITVSQFSPLAAMALATPEGGKLKGVSLHHFGGFVDAAWRENDYLWGRLDGAELVLRMLRGAAGPTSEPLSAADAVRQAGPQLKAALGAVLGSERDLERVAGLRATLARQVAELP